MIAILIDAMLISLAFWVFWRFFGGKKLYQSLTYDEAQDLEGRLDDIDERIAELPTAEQAGRTSPALEFLRGELERDRRRLQTRLHKFDREVD